MQDPLKQWKGRTLGRICSVPGCENSQKFNKGLTFYSYPNRDYEKERKKIWIALVRREPEWVPTKHSTICAAHFIGGIKSNDPRKENFYPTIFPWQKENESDVKRRKLLSDCIKSVLESSSTKNDLELDFNKVIFPIEPNVSKGCMKKIHVKSVQTDNYDHEEFQDVLTLFCWQDSSKNEVSTQTSIPIFQNSKYPNQNYVKSSNTLKGTCNLRQKYLKAYKACVQKAKQNIKPKFIPVNITEILNGQKDETFGHTQYVEKINSESNVNRSLKSKLPETDNNRTSDALNVDEYHVKKEINEELMIKGELEDVLFDMEIPNTSENPNMRNEEKEDEFIFPDGSTRSEKKSESNVDGKIQSGVLETDNEKMSDKPEVEKCHVKKGTDEILVINEQLEEDILFVSEIQNISKISFTRNEEKEDEYILPHDSIEADSQSTHPGIDSSDGKPHKSDLSQKTVKKLSDMNRPNTGEKPFSCDICQKPFRDESYLRIHELTHTNKKLHPCKICHKSFTEYSKLRVHYRLHKSGDKPFSCSVCGKKFALAFHLRKHELMPCQIEPFLCEICNKSFRHRASMRKHKSIHYDGQTQI